MSRPITALLLLILLTGCTGQKPIRVALCQMRVEQGRPEVNMATALRFCREAAEAGADLVVFPETFRLGWAADDTERLATPIPGPVTERLGEAARKHHLYIVAGLAEKASDGIYNSAVLIGPSGKLLHTHRKLWIVSRNVMQIDLYTEGDSIDTVDTPLGRLALLICADTQRPENIARAASQGAWLLFAPGAWAERPERLDDPAWYAKDIRFWEAIYGPAARKRRLFIFAVNGVGPMTESPWKGREFWGASLAYGPDGRQLAIGKRRREDLILIDIPRD